MDSHDVIVVNGGRPVTGTVQIGGAKNSVLKLMAASVMAVGGTRIDNVPMISDVEIMEEVLTTLGAKVTRGPERGLTNQTIFIDTSSIDSYETPYALVAKMRASISILGPLITRFGRAHVAMPGGCQIGSRKLDMHISSLEALGVEFEMDHGYIEATTPNGVRGAEVLLDFPSVGATENLTMASVCAQGTTTIRNAACEPEIVDLANFLNAMGADVQGAGTPNIIVNGVKELHPTQHTTVGDRIEAGTFLVAGALSGGPVTVEGVCPDHLASSPCSPHARSSTTRTSSVRRRRCVRLPSPRRGSTACCSWGLPVRERACSRDGCPRSCRRSTSASAGRRRSYTPSSATT